MTDCDVLVAGAGGAGLAAALTAAEAGCRVLVAEARTTFRQGSNTAMSTSMVPAGGTWWQAEAGIDDSPERFYGDVWTKTGGTADPVVTRALVTVAPDLVTWMAESLDVPLGLVTDFRYPGHSALRCHSVPDRAGRSLHAAMLAAADRMDGLHVMVPAELTEVLLDDGGGVAAAMIQRPDGSTEALTAGAVVLATNGFGANPDLVARHAPEIAGATYHGGDGSMGDALRIAGDLGLDTSHLDAYQGHGSLAVPDAILLTWAIVMHGGYLVDLTGQRFGDETVGYSEYAAEVNARPEGRAWVVYDRRIHEACQPFRDYLDVVDAGAPRWAGDVAGLAAATGLPADALATTVGAAAAAARGERPDALGRVDWEAPLEGELAAVCVTGALFHTQGGLRVDANGAVLRQGVPVPGLYAAGGAAVGMSGHGASGYLAGNGLLAALGLGRLAGRHAGQVLTPPDSVA